MDHSVKRKQACKQKTLFTLIMTSLTDCAIRKLAYLKPSHFFILITTSQKHNLIQLTSFSASYTWLTWSIVHPFNRHSDYLLGLHRSRVKSLAIRGGRDSQI